MKGIMKIDASGNLLIFVDQANYYVRKYFRKLENFLSTGIPLLVNNKKPNKVFLTCCQAIQGYKTTSIFLRPIFCLWD